MSLCERPLQYSFLKRVSVTGVRGGLEDHLTAKWAQATYSLLCLQGVKEESLLDVSLKILGADAFSRRAKRRLKLSVHFAGHLTAGVASGNTKTGFCGPKNTRLCQLENSEEIDGPLNMWCDDWEPPRCPSGWTLSLFVLQQCKTLTFFFSIFSDIQNWKRISPERTECVEPGLEQNLDHWRPAGSRLFDWTQLTPKLHHFDSK